MAAWDTYKNSDGVGCNPVEVTKAAKARIADLEDEARFLLARLNELEFSDLEDLHRDFCGHVEPSMSRLSGLLDKP